MKDFGRIIFKHSLKRPEAYFFMFHRINNNKIKQGCFMTFKEKLCWNIQRKSLCDKGIWKCICNFCQNISEICKILNGK